MNRFSSFRIVQAFAAGTVLAASGFLAVKAQELPDGNGKDVVEKICTACHDLEPVVTRGFSRADWETVIKSMIDMGAEITPAQSNTIAEYLAAKFPPKAK